MTVLSVHSFRRSMSEAAGKDDLMAKSIQTVPVVGGVDTHKDLHVAAVVDDNDQVLGTQSFATTRQGYKLMLTWMRSFGDLQRIGVECTGSYGAGLLRYMQVAGVSILEGELANHRTSRIAGGAAKTMTSMRKVLLMRPSRSGAR